ncbi:DUF177 domain-containing protein [Roseateles sp. YR242]|uniref:YceD family protein n=1 Tax=Roseateles sp. YR242 TaxID=1855305 RepID=UPI002101A3EA|nr:DUF177 domain-containing protein [Roseateles sp. YR242]
MDVQVFAREGELLEGEWPAAALTRLADTAAAEAPAVGWPAVRWSTIGEIRTPRGSEAQIWLRLDAQAQVAQTCQRCLKPVQEEVAVSRWFRFVRDEEQAAELDMDGDDDVLALPRHLNLQDLAEDELLLALPLVPRHDVCPEPLPLAEPDELEEEEAEERPNPFAALAALKKGTAGKA